MKEILNFLASLISIDPMWILLLLFVLFHEFYKGHIFWGLFVEVAADQGDEFGGGIDPRFHCINYKGLGIGE